MVVPCLCPIFLVLLSLLPSGLATAVGMSLLRLPSVVIDTVHRPLKAKCVFSSVMQLWRKCAVCNSHSSEVPQVVADF